MPCNDGLDGQLGITAKYFQKSGNNEAMYIQYDIKILINELSKYLILFTCTFVETLLL